MNVLSRLWRAVAGLAESVEALAGTVGEANGRLRQRLALDRPIEATTRSSTTLKPCRRRGLLTLLRERRVEDVYKRL